MMQSVVLPGHSSTVDTSPLEALYRANFRSLVRLAALVVDDVGTAEEVVQDAFVGTYLAWSRVDQATALSYVRRAVLNGARSKLRRRGVARRWAERTRGPDDAAAAEIAGVDSTVRGEVITAIRGLPDRQRECVLLRYYLDLSEAEIASTLGISPGTVKSSCHRALEKLQSLEALR